MRCILHSFMISTSQYALLEPLRTYLLFTKLNKIIFVFVVIVDFLLFLAFSLSTT